MSKIKPTYQELEERLAAAESIIDALKHHEVDAIVGDGKIAFLLLQKVEAAEHAAAAAQVQVQSIVDNTPAIVYAFDLEERFLIANAAIAKVLNSTPEQMIGRKRDEFMPKEDADWHEANDRKVVEAGQPIEFEECNQLNGRSITWLTSKFPLRDALGRIYAVAGISTDVSERKRVEEELKAAKVSAEQARAIAESASRAKDEFIAVLSHELRTPLAPALAAVSMMEADLRLPIETRQDLAMVRRNIAIEVRLIADLLDVSRVISGKLTVEKLPVDVAETIREAVKTVGADLDAKGQRITIALSGEPYLMFGDPARLQQLFWNLLRNANKFTPHGGGISIRTSVALTDGCPLAADSCLLGIEECPLQRVGTGSSQQQSGSLTVQVIDSGGGVPPELLHGLFSPFIQGKEARSFGGLGLGLSICRAVAELHGGSITAGHGGAGEGACFTVTLPITRCSKAQLETHGGPDESRGSGKGAAAPQASPPLRILLVEDHPDTARAMKVLLKAEGHEVTVADSVESALARVAQSDGKLDLLLSDLGLPDGTGHDLMCRLRERGNALPGLVLSGFGSPADIQKSEAAGFDEHLVKPVSRDMLVAAIKRVATLRPSDGT